jgi:hypothetical protein
MRGVACTNRVISVGLHLHFARLIVSIFTNRNETPPRFRGLACYHPAACRDRDGNGVHATRWQGETA